MKNAVLTVVFTRLFASERGQIALMAEEKSPIRISSPLRDKRSELRINMTIETAYKILGIDSNTKEKEIKKRYRRLMHHVHPDTDAFDTADYEYTAQEINEAYSFLCKYEAEAGSSFSSNAAFQAHHQSDRKSQKNQSKWNASVNGNAYTERNVYHYVEDFDGEIIGVFVVDTGKYIWNTNEDFPLFLKSMFECSKRLLDQLEEAVGKTVSASRRLQTQAELTYLLSQQFIDATATLQTLLTPISDADSSFSIYYIPSMLELSSVTTIHTGMTLYPAYLEKHRLFLKNKAGQEAGYVSFRDDRLYYIIIPLLEQKRAQIKVEVSQKQDKADTRRKNAYKNLDLWIKIPKKHAGTFPENINLQIKTLLKQYFVS